MGTVPVVKRDVLPPFVVAWLEMGSSTPGWRAFTSGVRSFDPISQPQVTLFSPSPPKGRAWGLLSAVVAGGAGSGRPGCGAEPLCAAELRPGRALLCDAVQKRTVDAGGGGRQLSVQVRRRAVGATGVWWRACGVLLRWLCVRWVWWWRWCVAALAVSVVVVWR